MGTGKRSGMQTSEHPPQPAVAQPAVDTTPPGVPIHSMPGGTEILQLGQRNACGKRGLTEVDLLRHEPRAVAEQVQVQLRCSFHNISEADANDRLQCSRGVP